MKDESDYPHLDPSTRAQMDRPPDERLLWLLEPRWIGYTCAQTALSRLEALMRHPPIHRMPNLLLVGPTNNGKTCIVQHFADRYPPLLDTDGERRSCPVVAIQMPPVPDEGRLYEEVLEQVQAPYRSRLPAAHQLAQVRLLLRHLKVKMLIVDELHHLLASRLERQRIVLNTLKFLGNDLQIPLVGVGTADALRAIQTDPQLANRFRPVALPQWTLNDEYRKLLASFERLLPLRQPSRLHALELATELLTLSEGTIGDLATVLTLAAEAAIRSGQERIDRALLRALDWDPPSLQRRRASELAD
ncbi:MAG: TniB family NTP-binding protein [Thiobacillaceae bacterium]|jgi:type II secretory pathway predicted ATPase ExeA|nr:TniB family NTP-binding protein [Thiobacillaceae bacterium]